MARWAKHLCRWPPVAGAPYRCVVAQSPPPDVPEVHHLGVRAHRLSPAAARSLNRPSESRLRIRQPPRERRDVRSPRPRSQKHPAQSPTKQNPSAQSPPGQSLLVLELRVQNHPWRRLLVQSHPAQSPTRPSPPGESPPRQSPPAHVLAALVLVAQSLPGQRHLEQSLLGQRLPEHQLPEPDQAGQNPLLKGHQPPSPQARIDRLSAQPRGQPVRKGLHPAESQAVSNVRRHAAGNPPWRRRGSPLAVRFGFRRPWPMQE